MRKTTFAVCSFLAAVSLRGLSLAAESADWPGWLGPNRDGKSLDKGLLKDWPADGPKLLWKADHIGGGYSGVAVCGQTVYITGDKDGKLVLFAFSPEGKPKWQAECGGAWTGSYPGSRATPTIEGGNAYLLSGNGVLGCFDAATGKPKWQRTMKEFGGSTPGWGYSESPLIYENLCIVKPGGKKAIVALDKTTGKDVWASSGINAGAEYSSCIAFTFDKIPMIVTGSNAGLLCVNARTGEKLWTNEFSAHNTANCPTPAYADGYVFWSNGYGKGGVCMKLEPGGKASVAWTTRDLISHHGGYIIENGYIYGNHENGVTCLELKTGRKVWNNKGVGKGSLCWADGMLYLFSENGGKAALATCSPEGMQIKGKVTVAGKEMSWAHPVVAGGRLYLRYDTNLYCFDVKAK